jgi:hypothetical protein
MPEPTTATDQPYVEALRRKPQTARDLAITLGRSADRSTVASIRATLERMERRGLVQRQRFGSGPWIWEAATDA